MFASVCETCQRPTVVCVCDRIVSYPTKRRVLILQHPREQDVVLGSAQLLVASLPAAKIAVGLSWSSLAHALGEKEVDLGRWAVLFPDRKTPGTHVTGRAGVEVDPKILLGIVAIDGSWSQAKSLWWRNPWLERLRRMTLAPQKPSIYGKLRPEPSREHISTLESVAAALTVCGEPPEIEVGLARLFRTLVQRGRDAKVGKRARAPKGGRSPGGDGDASP
jgi:DTW domain-containing protein YfiP